MVSGKDFDERRLPRPVLPNQAVDLAATKLKTCVGEYAPADEGLRTVPQPDD